MNKKEYLVKENQAFRLRLESWEALAPRGLISINLVQECLNKDGEVDFTSTYNYNLTKEEIAKLCKGLLEI
jgi:hypothetical protein